MRIEPVANEPLAFPPCPEPAVRIPRRQLLRRIGFAEHGYAVGCPGCDFIANGRPGEAHHNETCKARMELLLLQTEAGRKRVQRAQERSNEYIVHVYEQTNSEEAEGRG